MAKQQLQYEQYVYEKCCIEGVHLVELAGRPALLMPHFTPINIATADNFTKAQIRAAVEEFVKVHKLFHADMKPDHVVYQLPQKDQPGKVCFIDMASVRSLQPNEEDECVSAMLKKLNIS